MSKFVKIIPELVEVGLDALGMVQDNVDQALPETSTIGQGELLEDVTVSPGSTVNHRLGRQALGAIVVKQSDTTAPVLVTALSTSSVTLNGSFATNTTVSLWVF